MLALLLFQIPLLLKLQNIENEYFNVNWEDYEPREYVITLTMITDLLTIMFTVMLVLNLGVLLLSMQRLIKFLSTINLIRWLSYLLLVFLSILYINECFQMMAFYWGLPAFQLSWKLFYIDKFNFREYFQRSEIAVEIFKWSY